MVFNTIAGLFILAIVCGVGFGVASADSSNDLMRASSFGFSWSRMSANSMRTMIIPPILSVRRMRPPEFTD